MKISREIKIGIIGLATAGFLFLTINFLKGKNLFSSNKYFYAVYDKVNGLAPSKPVYLNGFQVGKVDHISLHPKMDGRILVRVSVDKKIIFSKNSSLEIFENGLIGGVALKINFSNQGAEAKSEDILKGIVAGSLTDALVKEFSPLKVQALKAAKSLDAVLISTNELLDEENADNLKKILKNVNEMVLSINLTSSTTNRLIDSNSQKVGVMLDNTNKLVVTTQKTVSTINEKAGKLELEKTMAKLDSALVSVKSILAKVDNNTGTIGRLINNPELYDNLSKTSLNLQELITDLKANPNKYVQISVFGK